MRIHHTVLLLGNHADRGKFPPASRMHVIVDEIDEDSDELVDGDGPLSTTISAPRPLRPLPVLDHSAVEIGGRPEISPFPEGSLHVRFFRYF